MSRGQTPLMLMMALSLPSTAEALGLGEIHVDSALNEPLAAEIDIVGATAEELAGLTATIASRETFVKFGADRPPFLSTATFKVAHDARGRPVLSVRSTDSFTEPFVNLVVDLRWYKGEVIRQYSLLLDPSGFPSAAQKAAALAAPTPVAAAAAEPRAALPMVPAPVSAPPVSGRTMTHVKIGSKATLRGVAWRVGARSEADLQKTMLAIFRANPGAFEGNINRLRLGANLSIPTAATIAAIPTADALHEIRAQMAAWRGQPKGATGVAAPTVAQSATAPASLPPPAETDAALNQRIETLEQGLHDMQGQLTREHDQLLGVQAQVKSAEKIADAASSAAPKTPMAPPSRLPAIFGGLTALAGALAAIYWKLRRRPAVWPAPTVTGLDAEPAHAVAAEPLGMSAAWNSMHDTQEAPVRAPPTTALSAATEDELKAAYEETMDLLGDTAILAEEIAAVSQESSETARLPATTVNLNTASLEQVFGDSAATLEQPVPEAALPVDTTHLDYNLLDLDMTAHHVQMPSLLHQPVSVKERRTSLVDVLKMAIEREPDRGDLRMKLLETYYAAAATNRQGFLEEAQKLARERERLPSGEWDKIALMGRQIASDTGLFAPEPDGEDHKLADCA